MSYCRLLLPLLRKAPEALALRRVRAKGAVQEKGGTCFHNGFEKLVLGKFRKSNDCFLILPQAYIFSHGYNYSPKHHCFLIIHFIAPGDCFLIKIRLKICTHLETAPTLPFLKCGSVKRFSQIDTFFCDWKRKESGWH